MALGQNVTDVLGAFDGETAATGESLAASAPKSGHGSADHPRSRRIFLPGVKNSFSPTLTKANSLHKTPNRSKTPDNSQGTEPLSPNSEQIVTWYRVPLPLSATKEPVATDRESCAFAELVFSEEVLDVGEISRCPTPTRSQDQPSHSRRKNPNDVSHLHLEHVHTNAFRAGNPQGRQSACFADSHPRLRRTSSAARHRRRRSERPRTPPPRPRQARTPSTQLACRQTRDRTADGAPSSAAPRRACPSRSPPPALRPPSWRGRAKPRWLPQTSIALSAGSTGPDCAANAGPVPHREPPP